MFSGFVANWTAFYSAHALIKTVVGFVHVGGLLAGGGCAITADLATISAARDSAAAQTTELRLLERTHEVVVAGLAALFVSGVFLLLADLDTYLYSWVFWIKMTLVALLLVNGWFLVRGERQVKRGESRAWSRLHRTAVLSLLLWFITTLLGAALSNIG